MQAASVMGHSPVLDDGRRVGTGFRDALWPDTPSLRLLDEHTGEVPTYLINADVHSVWLNSAAFRRESIAPTADGILREAPAFEISRRLNDVDPAVSDRFVRDALDRYPVQRDRGATGGTDRLDDRGTEAGCGPGHENGA